MKYRPRLFKDEMVRAILAYRKTETRSPVKLTDFGPSETPGYGWKFRDRRALWNDVTSYRLIEKYSPYGIPGDRLWVREAWDASFRWNISGGTRQMYARETPKEHRTKFNNRSLCHRSTCNHEAIAHKWMPSIFMPRWASRITLEVTRITVERLHEMTEYDAYSDGGFTIPNRDAGESYLSKFITLWDSIYESAGFGWDRNPWVWVCNFRMVTP